MNSVIVFGKGLNTNISICRQFEEVIEGRMPVYGFCQEDELPIQLLEDSLVVFTSEEIKDYFQKKYPMKVESLVARRVINYAKMNELIALPVGSEVLLVNNTKRSCDEAIEQLKRLGIDHVKYHPFYPEINKHKPVKLAITPGESDLCPSCVANLIDIGIRQIDITTIVEVLIKVNLLDDEKSRFISSEYVSEIVKLSKQYNRLANKYLKTKDQFEVIVDNTSEGILYLNNSGRISIVNEVFVSLSGVEKSKIIDEKLEDAVPGLMDLSIRQSNVIIRMNEKSLSATKVPIVRSERIVGYMITIRDVTEIQELEYTLRRKLQEKEYITKYCFDDVITKNAKVVEAIRVSKKIAASNSAILIQGESGTGKEIFAQAIHNHSLRKNRPFVPVNFAALSDSLLESQIFGYVEGAFTGAKKGGQLGFFEQAHGGTIFLDEIGDVPLKFQATLLRVLQEKQVRRVGGAKLIPIDVKVIAATNRDLWKMVESGQFRQDLYFRLNVLPLYLQPLRKRKEDIILLLNEYFQRYSGIEACTSWDFLTEEAIDLLISYNWHGNVRELVNIVEYVISIKEIDQILGVHDLPQYILVDIGGESHKNFHFPEQDNVLWILRKIELFGGIGRRKLSILSKQEGLNLTEAKINSLMAYMVKENLVLKNRGVKGTTITDQGIEVLLRNRII